MPLKIGIIGGGAAGLAALKVILETEEYKSGEWIPVLFEGRESIGGIWLPDAIKDDLPNTPLYDSLTTNIPHPIMAFQSLSFPPETPLFPRASFVLDYLKTYATTFDLSRHVRLNTSVRSITWVDDAWRVSLSTGMLEKVDRMIVANGHFAIPRYPSIPGLDRWRKMGKASHSIYYRHPEPYGDVVLVAGGGPSGRDITRDVEPTVRTLIWSIPGTKSRDNGKIKMRGAISKLLDGGVVQFEDGSKYGPVDHVILATGYEMSLPFLPCLQKGLISVSPFPKHLVNTTYSIFPLAKHIFPIQEDFPISSIAFLGVAVKIAPFPLMEVQARAIVHVFRYPSSLDSRDALVTMKARFQSLKSNGADDSEIAKRWHVFKPDNVQFEYRNSLLKFAGVAPDWEVESWAPKFYAAKNQLRAEWEELERRNEAKEWLKGVGYNGIEDWVDLMTRLLDKATVTSQVIL